MLTAWYPRVTKPLGVSQPIVSANGNGNNDDNNDNVIGDTVYDDDVDAEDDAEDDNYTEDGDGNDNDEYFS
jgi:hypothetical protein